MDFRLYQKNGSYFYEKDLDEILKKDCNLDLDKYKNDDFDWNIYAYPSIFCPICNLDHIPEHIKIKYALKKLAQSEFALNKEIQYKFEQV